MTYRFRVHSVYGPCLFADNGTVEAGIPLNFGLRIGHFSFCGENNVFFEQPQDMATFTTDKGWRLRGGHRMWIAPESPQVYYPDNDPIAYDMQEDTLVLTQPEDPWLKVVKQMYIKLQGTRMQVTHRLTNTADTPRDCALWAISVVAPGGTLTVNFERRDGGYDPWHRIAMWDYTDLGDVRATYTRDQIRIRHLPMEERYKIGVGHPCGPVFYENGDTVLVKHFDVDPSRVYPDGNVSFETFFSKYMAEIESLSPLTTIQPGESAEYTEVLELLKRQ